MGREGQVVDEESELRARVRALLHLNQEAEQRIARLERKIKGLTVQLGRTVAEAERHQEVFDRARISEQMSRKLIEDLRAENRTLRVALRGIALAERDRFDDPLSSPRDSVND